MANIQSKTFGEIRREVGTNCGLVIVGSATSTTDTTSLIDTANLWGADDAHNQKQVRIYETTDGNAPQGENRIVSDYAGSTHDATTAAFTAAITSGDKYEMWETPIHVADINSIINQVIMKYTSRCPQIKDDRTLFTMPGEYRYTIPSGFVSLYELSYAQYVGESKTIDNCDEVWTAGTNATITLDTSVKKQGSACMKIAIADAASTNEVIAYDTIDELDISKYDTLEVTIYSTIALTAGALEYHLDDTAAIASGVETLDIPAMAANTWYTHSIALANPMSDTAIISHGLYQVTDVGACTVYIDNVRVVNSKTKSWAVLSREDWGIVRGSTNYIELTRHGLAVVGANTQMRLLGYQNPDLLTNDTDVSDIDPGWLINMATAELLANTAFPMNLDNEARMEKAQRRFSEAERNLSVITTQLMSGTEVI